MQEIKKIDIVKSIPTEEKLRIDLILPLFRKMDFRVIDNQGPNEFGTDAILKSVNKLGVDEYISIVLKKDDINNKAGSPTGILKILRDQVEQAATVALEHPEIKKDTYPNSVWLITNGKISNNAKSVFNKMLKEQFKTLVNVEYLDNRNLVELIDRYWPEFYSDRRPFLSQYAEQLKKQLLDINISDIAETNKNIEDVLIPQMLIEKKNIDELSNRKINIRRLPVLPINLLSNKKKIIFISGEAGAGKSTLFKRLAIEIAEKEVNVPIVISAKEIIETEYNVERIYDFLGRQSDSVDENGVRDELDKAKIVLLVDGLDEIRETELRKNTLKKLIKLVNDDNNIEKMIVSTRPESNAEILAISRPITTFQVQPVQSSQVTTFFSRWFGTKHKSKANQLLKELTSKAILDKLPKTPLTLTLLAIVYETRDDLPTTLTELYRIFSELLLGKLDHRKGINPIKDTQVKSGMLSFIAWEMHKSGQDDIRQEEMISFADIYLKEQLGDDRSDSKEIIQNIIDRSALLIPTEDKIKFRHLSFQEYFAARKIYSQKIFRDNLSDWIEDPWWSDVLFFASGSLKNLDDHIEILEKKEITDVFSTVYSIGGMLQAAYETSAVNKKRLIRFAKENIPKAIEQVQNDLSKSTEQRLPKFIPYAVVLSLLTDNYSSSYLNTSLEYELSDLVGADAVDDDMVIQNFFLAAAMAKSGNIDGLQGIATNPDIQSPVILLLTDMLLDEYDSNFNKGVESLVHKKVKKKISKNLKAIRTVLAIK